VRDPRELSAGDGVAVLLARLRLRESDRCNLRVRVDRTRYRTVVDDGVVAAHVLGGDLPLAERRVRKLPVAGAVADGIDVRNARLPALVGADALALVELHADLLEP